MPDVEKSPILSIESGEVVPRGRPVLVRGRRKLADRSPSGVAVPGQTPSVTSSEDGREVIVDTSELPAGPHRLMVSEVAESRSGNRLAPVAFVSWTPAPTPHRARTSSCATPYASGSTTSTSPGCRRTPRRGDRTSTPSRPYPQGAPPLQLAFDEKGNAVDLDEVLAGVAKRRLDRFGELHPALHEAVARGGDVEVAVWLDVPDDAGREKRARPEQAPTAAETRPAEAWQRAAKSSPRSPTSSGSS